MKALINTVQKQIGLFISLIGILVIIINILGWFAEGKTLIEALMSLSVWMTFVAIIPYFISIFLESRILKILQIAMIFLLGGTNILQSAYQEFYGPTLFLTGWLLMRHYGFLETYPKTKNTLVLLLVAGLSQASSIIHSTMPGVYAGFSTLAFFLFLFIFLLILWRDMVAQQKLLKKENVELKMNYGQLSAKIAELEENKQPFDLKSAGISPAEERVIRTLTVYKASNREIAERLNIAESTVKLHLYNIYNKIGVDNRFAIIDLCKYNYSA